MIGADKIIDTWATSRENVSSGIFDQVTFKPACSATEARENLETLDIASIHIILSKQRTTKVLIRLRGCTGWYAPLLFAWYYAIRHIFTWRGPHVHVSLTTRICARTVHFQLLALMLGVKLRDEGEVKERFEVACLLIKNGAKVNVINRRGRTPLQCGSNESLRNAVRQFAQRQ